MSDSSATYDLAIRNALVVDGTGRERFPADIGIKDGRIVAVGDLTGDAEKTIDAGGKVVSPGFIDIHTHYDAQVFWDPTVGPSSFHGVTTIVGGNCGFSIAPLNGKTEDGQYLMRMLSRVEGMPLESLEAGVPWDWTTFASYLDKLDGNLAVNAGFMVGHCALRRAVMGARAVGERAQADDIARMQDLLRDSIAEGGLGFSTTVAPVHTDAEGQPIPSRWASDEEVYALASVVSEFEGTCLEYQPNNLDVFSEAEVERMTNVALAGQRPLNWNLFLSVGDQYERHVSHLAASDHARERGAHVTALASCQPMTTRINLHSGFIFDLFEGWGPIMRLPIPERKAALADPAVRADLGAGLARQGGMMAMMSDLSRWKIAETVTPELRDLTGRTLGDLAAERRSTSLDVLLDIALAEELKTSFLPPPAGDDPESWRLRAESWRDDRTIVGGSDAGAHLDMIDTFAFSTMILGEGVRERGIFTLEEGVRQITSVPAAHLGLMDRGELREGALADLVVFDPDTIACGPVHTRHDLPAGAMRLYADALGIAHVVVNGTEIIRGQEFLGVYPGTILRSGRDTRTAQC
jgi:N-acyl-D-aspartate/D-glutamate deacylase